jgi:ketosteroid isomerase-like protein
MSEENVEVVRRAIDAYNRGDPEGFLAEVHPDVESLEDPRVPGGKTLRGREEVERYLKSLSRYWESIGLAPERFVDLGDDVLVLARMSAQSVRGGPEIERPLDQLVSLRDGKVIRTRIFSSRKEALEAAGLSE